MRVVKNSIFQCGEDIGPGYERYTVSYIVADLPTDNPDTALSQAKFAPGIPRRLVDGYPAQPQALAAYYKVEPLTDERGQPTRSHARVLVTFERILGTYAQLPVNLVVDFGTSTRIEPTDTDRDGKMIAVPYNGRPNQPQRGEVTRVVQDDVIVYRKWIDTTGKGLAYPTPVEWLKNKYRNAVNSDNWRGGVPHQWKVTDINATTEDTGNSYTITIRVERREETWDAYAYYHLPNGEIPRDVRKPTGAVSGGTIQNGNGVWRVTNLYPELPFAGIEDDLDSITAH